MDGPEARDALLDLVDEPALGPAALTSLRRMRMAGQIGAIKPEQLRPILEIEIGRGLRYSLVASTLQQDGSEAKSPFVAQEF